MSFQTGSTLPQHTRDSATHSNYYSKEDIVSAHASTATTSTTSLNSTNTNGTTMEDFKSTDQVKQNGTTIRGTSSNGDDDDKNKQLGGTVTDNNKNTRPESTGNNEDNTNETTTTTTTPSIDLSALIPTVISTSLSTSALEYRLRQLREASTQHSQILTQKLASSQSGQNLLHMGTSLSTVPPDLHNLMTQLHPFVLTVEQTEKDELERLETLILTASKLKHEARRVQQAQTAANLYADLIAAEKAVEYYRRNHNKNNNKALIEETNGKHVSTTTTTGEFGSGRGQNWKQGEKERKVVSLD